MPRLSDRRIRLLRGRLQLYIEPRDWWVGLFIGEDHLYFAAATLVVRWERTHAWGGVPQ